MSANDGSIRSAGEAAASITTEERRQFSSLVEEKESLSATPQDFHEEQDDVSELNRARWTDFRSGALQERRVLENNLPQVFNSITPIPYTYEPICRVDLSRRPDSFMVMSVTSFNSRFFGSDEYHMNERSHMEQAAYPALVNWRVVPAISSSLKYIAAQAYCVNPRAICLSDDYSSLLNGVATSKGVHYLYPTHEMYLSDYLVKVRITFDDIEVHELFGGVTEAKSLKLDIGEGTGMVPGRGLAFGMRKFFGQAFYFRGGLSGPGLSYVVCANCPLQQLSPSTLTGVKLQNALFLRKSPSFEFFVWTDAGFIPIYRHALSIENVAWLYGGMRFDQLAIVPRASYQSLLFDSVPGFEVLPVFLPLLLRALMKCHAMVVSSVKRKRLAFFVIPKHLLTPPFTLVVSYLASQVNRELKDATRMIFRAMFNASFLLFGFTSGQWWGESALLADFSAAGDLKSMFEFLTSVDLTSNTRTLGGFVGLNDMTLLATVKIVTSSQAMSL
jgi:hypothetical protein